MPKTKSRRRQPNEQAPVRRSSRPSTRAASTATASNGRRTSNPNPSRQQAGEPLSDLLGLIRDQVRAEIQAQQAMGTATPTPAAGTQDVQTTSALGTLPPAHLLTSVSLATGSQTAPSFSSPTHPQPLFPVTTGTPPSLANPLPSSHSTVPSPHAGMVLSPAAEPFPRKLVEKVRSGQFIEMRELLADNIGLIYQLESIQGCTPLHTLGPTRPRLREVSSLPTWCYCFLGYMAILTSDPSTRDQLAYARLVIKEALRHGGQGWLDYDRAFRQQAAAEPSLR